MVKCLFEGPELDQTVDRIRHVYHNQRPDWDDEVPLLTLIEQDEEAHVEVGVKPGYLSHDRLDEVPFIEPQYLLVVDLSLDADHEDDLDDPVEDRVDGIHAVGPHVQAVATFVYEEHRDEEDNEVIDTAIGVQRVGHRRHDLVLHHLQAFRVVLEPEGFVLRVDEGAPAPQRKASFLSAGQLMAMIHFKLFNNFFHRQLVAVLIELLDSAYVLIVRDGEFDLHDDVVDVQHGEESLQGLVLNHVVTNVQDLDALVHGHGRANVRESTGTDPILLQVQCLDRLRFSNEVTDFDCSAVAESVVCQVQHLEVLEFFEEDELVQRIHALNVLVLEGENVLIEIA